MKVRLLENCSAGKAGAELELPDDAGQELVNHNSARKIDVPKAAAVEEAAPARTGKKGKIGGE